MAPFFLCERMSNLSIGREGRLLTLLGALLATAWTLVVGKDVHWDLVNHHLYLPFSLVSGRFQHDLFGAGPAAYQNPLGYLPFYAMVRGGWPSWAIGVALASLHGLVIWPVYRIAAGIWPDVRDRLWRVMACALALVSPLFLTVVGTSSIDPLSNLLVLQATSLLMASATLRRATASGALIGLAFAMKPINAIFVIALFALALLRWSAGQATVRHLLGMACAAAITGAMAMGPWSWWLWHEFGNPLFPLYNQWFKSPFAPVEAGLSLRFAPTSAWDLLTRPFLMAGYAMYVATEMFTPDLRPAVAVVATALAGAKAVVHGKLNRQVLSRADFQVLAFCVAAYVPWIFVSGNARYALPLSMLAGLVAVRSLQFALPATWARTSIALLLALQGLYFGIDGDHRMRPAQWDDKPYVQMEVPQPLRNEPFLHLVSGTQTFAAVALAMHPDGELINVIGQMSLPLDGPLGERLKEHLARWRGRTRVLVPLPMKDPGQDQLQVPADLRPMVDRLFQRLGIRANFSDCLAIRLMAPPLGKPERLAATVIASCGIVEREDGRGPGYDEAVKQANRVFSAAESSCPTVFSPPPMVTEGVPGLFARRYISSDAVLTLKEGELILSHNRAMGLVLLGREQDILAGRPVDACGAWKMLMSKEG